MADRPALAALPLERAAVLIGAYCWIERRLFELTGSWSVDPAPTEVQVALDGASAEHAWHAQLWADRLPVLEWFDPDTVTVPAPPAIGPLFEALAGLTGPVGRLTGLYRVVLPRLLVTYDRHLALAVPATDGPTVRALRLVRRDEVESWRAGEALLQELLGRPEDAEAASATQGHLEAIVVGAGVRSGLIPWPDGGSDPLGRARR